MCKNRSNRGLATMTSKEG
jgi:hypothetical protein